MSIEHVTVFTGSTLEARRIKNVLEENGIGVVLKEDKIVGYEISNNLSELLVLNVDEVKAKAIISEIK